MFANRTRATSFVVMVLVPAAMFSMFYFLSLFIQQVMGYSPLHTGFAFLPFSVGIVIGAAISSNLVSRIDPRYIAGVGTLMAAVALFGFSRLSVPHSTADLVAIGRTAPRRRRELLDVDLPVHRADGGRHGPDVRAR